MQVDGCAGPNRSDLHYVHFLVEELFAGESGLI